MKLVKGTFAALLLIFGSAGASSQKVLWFYFTGNCTAFTVPEQVNQLDVKLIGGCGGSNSFTRPGYGAQVTATIYVSEGEVYYFCPGGAGAAATGGWNGGGDGEYSTSSGQSGYGGGGASDIRTSLNDLSSRILVAAGGGGTGVVQSSALYYSSGGYGGCTQGSSGSTPANGVSCTAATGGTETSGGAGGTYPGNNAGYSGTIGTGGNAGAASSGGGGGGGYYGGGGGSNNGGGGGSSLYSGGSNIGNEDCGYPSYSTGDGYIQLTYNKYTVYNDRYDYTGQAVSFSVPSDVKDMVIQAYGAAGASSSQGQGGAGGYILANLSIPDTGFDTLWIEVGGQNGYNGGGSSGCSSAGVGGGASVVYTTTYTLVTAGGGGGAGYDANCTTECSYDSINGGMGGSWNGVNGSGSGSPMTNESYGGGGGYQYSGGLGGYYPPSYRGVTGASLLGGSGGSGSCGGGGGGGYYGGGGGANTGGGGGSSAVLSTPVTGLTVVMDSIQEGVNSGNGYVIISYTSSTAVTDDDTSTDSNDDHPTGANGPVIIGSIIVVIVFLCGLCVCLYFWRAWKNRKEAALLAGQQANQMEPSAPHVVNAPYVPPQSSYYITATSPISKSGSTVASAPPAAAPVYTTAEAQAVDPRLSDYHGSPIVATRLDDDGHPL